MSEVQIALAPPARRRSLGSDFLLLLRLYPLGAFGAVLMALFVFAALFAGWVTQFDPLSTNARLSLRPPDSVHWMGADVMGRDVYSRIV
jgi:peptide/nickel transport system permease protein